MTDSHRTDTCIATKPDTGEFLRIVAPLLSTGKGTRVTLNRQKRTCFLTLWSGQHRASSHTLEQQSGPPGFAERTSPSLLSWERDLLKTI